MPIQPLLDLHDSSCIAGAVRGGKQLQGGLLVEHRIVLGDCAAVLDAECARQIQIRVKDPVGYSYLGCWDTETRIKTG